MLDPEGQPGRTWSRGCTVWWGGKDSNLGSRWQQIYSLPPLSTRVPPHEQLPALKVLIYGIRLRLTLPTNERQKSRLMQNQPPLLPSEHGVVLAYWAELDRAKMF